MPLLTSDRRKLLFWEDLDLGLTVDWHERHGSARHSEASFGLRHTIGCHS